MSNSEMTKMLNPGNIKAFSPFFAQSTTYTEIHGEMSSEQIDREQRIKACGIFAASVVILGSMFMFCHALAGNK